MTRTSFFKIPDAFQLASVAALFLWGFIKQGWIPASYALGISIETLNLAFYVLWLTGHLIAMIGYGYFRDTPKDNLYMMREASIVVLMTPFLVAILGYEPNHIFMIVMGVAGLSLGLWYLWAMRQMKRQKGGWAVKS